MDLPEYLRSPEPYFMTPPHLAKRKLELLDLQAGETLFDLGSGDGAVLIQACQMADVKGVGYEILPEALTTSRQAIAAAGLSDRIEIRATSYLEADLSTADALVLYLTRTVLGGLSLKLEKELRPGTRIVTHEFDIPGWKAEAKHLIAKPNSARKDEVWVYRR